MPPRMRAPLRKAIELIATKGITQTKAAEAAGMNLSALNRALHRPEVAAYLEHRKAQFCLDVEKLRGTAKAMAILTGMDLMQNSGSDQVKAKMVEFFAGEGRQPLVNITLPGNEPPATGYLYTRPGDRPTDRLSGAHGGQVIEGKAEPDDV